MPVISSSSSAPTRTNVLLDYSVNTQFTYTAAQVEFANGVAKLKNQFASDVVSASTYATTDDLTYSRDGGSLTGTPSGTVSITSGQLDMTGAPTAYKKVEYLSLGNVFTGNTGTIRMRITPNYTGTPGTSQFYFVSSRVVDGTNNFVLIQHGNDGNMYFYIYDKAGATLAALAAAWSPTSGTQYEIEAAIDATAGVFSFYIGANRLVTGGVAGTINHVREYFRYGSNLSDSNLMYANFKIDDLVIYDAVQTVGQGATRTTGYVVPTTKYLTTDPLITQTVSTSTAELHGFQATSSASGTDGVKYHILVEATPRYWNGSAWANSDQSYAQSNTAADIHTNATSLLSATSNIKVVAVLRSADGSTTPTLGSVSLLCEA